MTSLPSSAAATDARTDAETDAEFVAATEPFRRELLAHCYRMLGSIHDAEDLVQETYLRAWRGFDGFEGRSSVRLWLYKIATMACLTALETRKRRPLPSGLAVPSLDHRVPLAPAQTAEPWLQPAPDAVFGAGGGGAGGGAGGSGEGADPAAVVVSRVGVRLAFIAALQTLPAGRRAVLILRDVLGCRAAEVADMLGISPAAVNSTLRRARAQLQLAAPIEDEVHEPDEAQLRTVLDSYVDAFVRADLPALAALLRADVELEMPPIPTWFAGREAVLGFLAEQVIVHPGDWLLTPTRANGQPALIAHGRTADGSHAFHGIQVLSLAAGQIVRITSFNDAALAEIFQAAPRVVAAMPPTVGGVGGQS